MSLADDTRFMRRALRLAARGYTEPNPMVGCVLVQDGQIVAEGYHLACGRPHAEIEALNRAGGVARGATVYVNLEPCCYHGRTPPCTDALIAAGVRRVVIALPDPNPRVDGRGIRQLRAAGVNVQVGVLAGEAAILNEAFIRFQRTRRPFTTLKAAMSVDGKIATRTGESQWITGEKARDYVHIARARSGAVVVGVGTILADDPQLTARPRQPPARQPLRVILDSRLRTSPEARAVQVTGPAPTAHPLLILTTSVADPTRRRALVREGAEVLQMPATPDGRVDLTAAWAELGRRSVTSALAEGGGELHTALLAAGLVDKALLFVAPIILGGDARSVVGGQGPARLCDARRLGPLRVRRLGEDLAIEAEVYGIVPCSAA